MSDVEGLEKVDVNSGFHDKDVFTNRAGRAKTDASELNGDAVFVEAMLLMRQIRDVSAVGRWLRNPRVIAQGFLDGEVATQISECRLWFEEADAFEKDNGKGSLLDRTHPFWVKSLEPALRRVEHILLSQATTRS